MSPCSIAISSWLFNHRGSRLVRREGITKSAVRLTEHLPVFAEHGAGRRDRFTEIQHRSHLLRTFVFRCRDQETDGCLGLHANLYMISMKTHAEVGWQTNKFGLPRYFLTDIPLAHASCR